MIQKHHRTAHGTELPILNLRGKDYLEVKYRIVWFREDHPDWPIQTEIVSHSEVRSVVCAKILNESGQIMSMAHKAEDKSGFGDHLEKSETGAIGRALALIGYGTQFCADDLDEGPRIVDAPAERPTKPAQSKPQKTPPPSPPLKNHWEEVRNKIATLHEEKIPIGPPPPMDYSEEIPFQDARPAALADQPVPRTAGDFVIEFGRKYKGVKLSQIPINDLTQYIEWLEGTRPTGHMLKQLNELKEKFLELKDLK